MPAYPLQSRRPAPRPAQPHQVGQAGSPAPKHVLAPAASSSRPCARGRRSCSLLAGAARWRQAGAPGAPHAESWVCVISASQF